MDSIEPDGIDSPGPDDRTGPLLAELFSVGGPDGDVIYKLDVELWHLSTREARQARLNELRQFVENRGGTITDQLERDGLLLARVKLAGAYIRELLTIPTVAVVDLPPRAGFSIIDVQRRQIDGVPPARPPDADAPHVCVIDSGLSRGHPLLQDAIGETIAAPFTLGDGLDVHGHGTMVAGVALYGDVDAAWQRGEIVQELWIDGARVTNENNEFDDDRLIPTQMIEAIEYFADLGCRVFNVSLGDPRLPLQSGARPSSWAETLDNLANRLGVLIIVSAGNYFHHQRDGVVSGECASHYPRYLLDDAARIIEPATGANVLTVGAVSGNGEPAWAQRFPDDVPPMPIARPGQPSPFTRSGFGVHDAIKPELVEVGGNLSYDPRADRVLLDPGLGIVSLDWQHEHGRLFRFESGTSFAAPKVAHMAAQVNNVYPDSSANLVRALLVHGARIPDAVSDLVLTDDERLRLCGFGQPDLDRVLYSTDRRAVLVADAELRLDWFHVYEVPIPALLRDSPGERRISITLAFDPPVRRRRAEYLGNKMAFRLVRGLSIDQVVRIFSAPDPVEGTIPLPVSNDCPMMPGPRRRERGTIQHAEWVIQRNRGLEYQEPFYLVVRSERGWQLLEDLPQTYAVVVSLEHCARDIPLYENLRIRSRVVQRARVQG